MFDQLTKLTIKGGYFDAETNLDVFKPNEPLSIVYGRNGSGKTTIARCVRQLAESEDEKEKRLERIANGEDTEYEVSSTNEIAEENKLIIALYWYQAYHCNRYQCVA